MGFSLTIQEGKDLGRQYAFDQPEVSIGRTAENDVVLYDPGVSRKHVVIRQQAGRFYVQDMGSANGTQVNGNAVSEEELQTGDLVSVGPVVFAFEVQKEGGHSTRIVDPAEVASKRKGGSGSKALAKSNSPSQLKATGQIAAAGRRPSALAKPAPNAVSRPSKSGGISARPKPQAAPMLASERARLKRQNAGPIGRIKLAFMEAPKPVRLGIIGVGGLLAAIVLVSAVTGFLKTKTVGPGSDCSVPAWHCNPFKIGESASKDIYGYGDELGVTVSTKDEVHFQFEYTESVPVVYYVKFEALGVADKAEVELTLNGVHVGFANAGMGEYTKAQRIKLPKKYLKPGIPNEIVFDNVKNPPGANVWAIAKAKLIIKPLPVCSKDECSREAKKLYDLADLKYSQKGIAAANLFEAWMALHKSLLFLENVDPKPDLYTLAQGTLRDIDRELDLKCSKIFLGAKKEEELGNEKKALNEYKNGLMYFPSGEDEHACRQKLLDRIQDYGDTGPGSK